MRKFSPSALGALEACPKFVYDESKDTTYSDEGQLLHKAVETGDTVGLNEEQAEMVEHCLGFLSGVTAHSPGKHEVPLRITTADGDLLSGRVDFLGLNHHTARTAEVIDWKFGSTPVASAKFNPQLQAYALMTFNLHLNVDAVTTHIVAPRLALVTSHTWQRSQLPELELRIGTILARAKDPECQPTMSMDACRWCAAKSTCQVLSALVIRQDYTPIPIITKEEYAIMAPETRAKAQQLTEIFEDWAKQVRKNNAQFVQNGGEIPGYALQTRLGNVSIDNLPLAFQTLLTAYGPNGLTQDDLLRACSLSLTKLSPIIKELAKGGSDKEMKKKLEETLTAFIVRGEAYSFLKRKTKRETV